jgi:transcriptional regulator with XRE-family HTH domain
MEDEEGAAYAARLGYRLRDVRRQRGWSLHDVEVVSRGEFKASALGTYERGDRRITLERLQRLARLYRIPVDLMLPDEDATGAPIARRRGVDDDHVVIDLVALDTVNGPDAEELRRYVEMIRNERQDWNGRVLSMRRGDVRQLARLGGHEPTWGRDRLDDLGLLHRE